MKKFLLPAMVAVAFLFGAGFTYAASQQKQQKGGYVIEHDAEMAKEQPGPLLKTYWSIPPRRIETSVVLANGRWIESHQPVR